MPDASLPAPPGGRLLFIWYSNLNGRYRDLANAAFMLGDYAAAETALKKSMTAQQQLTERTLDRERDVAQSQILLAMILARQGRQADAQQAVAPALKLHRDLHARKDNEDLTQRIELAQAPRPAGRPPACPAGPGSSPSGSGSARRRAGGPG